MTGDAVPFLIPTPLEGRLGCAALVLQLHSHLFLEMPASQPLEGSVPGQTEHF